MRSSFWERHSHASQRRDHGLKPESIMTKEMFWLTMTVVLTGVIWIPYIIDRAMVRGLMGSMGHPYLGKPQSEWAQRMMHAHANAVENLVVFGLLVLIADAQNIRTDLTAFACALYFW